MHANTIEIIEIITFNKIIKEKYHDFSNKYWTRKVLKNIFIFCIFIIVGKTFIIYLGVNYSWSFKNCLLQWIYYWPTEITCSWQLFEEFSQFWHVLNIFQVCESNKDIDILFKKFYNLNPITKLSLCLFCIQFTQRGLHYNY